MGNDNLIVLINEIACCGVAFDATKNVQYNLFEHTTPETLAFNGCHSLSDYRNNLRGVFSRFKKEFDKQASDGKYVDVSEIIMLIEELEAYYYLDDAGGQTILLHDSLFISKTECEYDIVDVKLKLSGFISAQKKNIGGDKEICSCTRKTTGA